MPMDKDHLLHRPAFMPQQLGASADVDIKIELKEKTGKNHYEPVDIKKLPKETPGELLSSPSESLNNHIRLLDLSDGFDSITRYRSERVILQISWREYFVANDSISKCVLVRSWTPDVEDKPSKSAIAPATEVSAL